MHLYDSINLNWTILIMLLVLFQAETYVALYGLGNIRDERLKQMLQVVVYCTTLL